jgi:alkyl hydroperoxide reductase subunit AhpC
MATLWMNGDNGPLLRDWLQGDWAILFSHPTDFEYQGLENDRWLAILREEFGARAVRPLACNRAVAELDSGWADDLTGDCSVVRLDVLDPASRALREDIQSMPPRFVLIVDQELQRRGVLKYSAGRSNISPLDLLATIDVLRRRSQPHRQPHAKARAA